MVERGQAGLYTVRQSRCQLVQVHIHPTTAVLQIETYLGRSGRGFERGFTGTTMSRIGAMPCARDRLRQLCFACTVGPVDARELELENAGQKSMDNRRWKTGGRPSNGPLVVSVGTRAEHQIKHSASVGPWTDTVTLLRREAGRFITLRPAIQVLTEQHGRLLFRSVFEAASGLR
jgi:hypothetical protein